MTPKQEFTEVTMEKYIKPLDLLVIAQANFSKILGGKYEVLFKNT